jgi:hypothetical protein
LVSDIPAGDGKIYDLFLQCRWERGEGFRVKLRDFKEFQQKGRTKREGGSRRERTKES